MSALRLASYSYFVLVLVLVLFAQGAGGLRGNPLSPGCRIRFRFAPPGQAGKVADPCATRTTRGVKSWSTPTVLQDGPERSGGIVVRPSRLHGKWPEACHRPRK
jgi:hypothetical protein